MICIVGNRPVLQIGRHQITGYDTQWLHDTILRGAEAAERADFPFVDDLMEGILHYLDHKCPLRVITIEELHARVRRMLERIGSVENIPDFIERVKRKEVKMFGFGHRVYKNFDPRANVIRGIAEEVFSLVGRDPLIDVAVALEKHARTDEYFIKRKLYPNVDFYSGLVYRALGFPPEFFTVLFAIPRAAGYLAHWREQLADPDLKIARPQQVYKGEWLRDYPEINQRDERQEHMGVVRASNATRRRMAGTRGGTGFLRDPGSQIVATKEISLSTKGWGSSAGEQGSSGIEHLTGR